MRRFHVSIWTNYWSIKYRGGRKSLQPDRANSGKFSAPVFWASALTWVVYETLFWIYHYYVRLSGKDSISIFRLTFPNLHCPLFSCLDASEFYICGFLSKLPMYKEVLHHELFGSSVENHVSFPLKHSTCTLIGDWKDVEMQLPFLQPKFCDLWLYKYSLFHLINEYYIYIIIMILKYINIYLHKAYINIYLYMH